jgi:hypothetical protein
MQTLVNILRISNLMEVSFSEIKHANGEVRPPHQVFILSVLRKKHLRILVSCT